MATFGIKLKPNEVSITYFERLRHRLQSHNFFKNPFIGNMKEVKEGIYGITIRPLYPPFYLSGFLVMSTTLLIPKWWMWFVGIGCLLLATSYLWTSHFFYSMLKLGLRKANYKDKIEYLSASNLSEICIYII